MVRGLATTDGLGRGGGSQARREPLDGHGGAPVRPGAPVRKRRPAGRVGRHRGKGLRLLASRAPAVIIGRPPTGQLMTASAAPSQHRRLWLVLIMLLE